jgi:uncharacterized protein
VKVDGRATLAAPRDAVFAAICDPGVLLEVIPGAREVRRGSAGEYRGRLVLRLPAMVGEYETVVRLVEEDAPDYGELEGRVSGRVGGITGHACFRLSDAPDGGTLIEYAGTGVISGALARLDSRFMEGVARSLIDEGLVRLGDRLGRVPAAGARQGWRSTIGKEAAR